MIAKHNLNSPIWKTPERRKALDKTVRQNAAELEKRIKQKIRDSRPAGKTYRRNPISRKIAKRDLAFFRSNKAIFKRKFSDLYKEKTVVGYKFHRASRRGQAPAIDSGSLINSIRARRLKQLHSIVATNKNYAQVLDDPTKLNRPFFESTANEFRAQFKANIAAKIAELNTQNR